MPELNSTVEPKNSTKGTVGDARCLITIMMSVFYFSLFRDKQKVVVRDIFRTHIVLELRLFQVKFLNEFVQ